MINKVFLIRVRLSGVNLNKIFKLCKLKNIKLYNITRVNYKNIEFDIPQKNKKSLIDLSEKCNYKFEIICQYGLVKAKTFLEARIGVVFGIFIFVLGAIFSSCFTWNIKIYGLNRVDSDAILNVLSKNGIKQGKICTNFNNELLEEKILEERDDISLCSVIKKGSTIIVNIKEKLLFGELDDLYKQQDIVASQNLTIKSIGVVQGTALKKEGDSVKSGDVIVAGYFLDINGNKVPCKANAEIFATTWHTSSYTYPKKITILKRTGNKISTSFMTIFGVKLPISLAQNKFNCFEEKTSEKLMFNNNILPFKKTTTTFFEATEEVIEQNFALDRDKIVKQCKNNALKQVLKSEIISKTFETITENEDNFIVTSYVEIDLQL